MAYLNKYFNRHFEIKTHCNILAKLLLSRGFLCKTPIRNWIVWYR